MIEEEEQRRLFFGAQIIAPWPKDLPKARIISEEVRHITLAFLGLNCFAKIQDLIPSIPIPSLKVGPAGIGKELVFLPKDKSRVIALSVHWLDQSDPVGSYRQDLSQWLISNGFSLDKRPFFPHITLARAPFDKEQWEKQFAPIPFFVQGINLYQSLGNLHYESLWENRLLSPFEELDHTADIAFLIRGVTVQQLFMNAQLALAFKDPKIVDFFLDVQVSSLKEIIISLNEIVAKADIAFGCPFKAVSFHGEIKMDEPVLQWEMIVDV